MVSKNLSKGSISEYLKLYSALSVEVVSGLIDILKNVLSKPESEGPEKTEYISQIDKIFRSGDGNYPIVNWISCN